MRLPAPAAPALASGEACSAASPSHERSRAATPETAIPAVFGHRFGSFALSAAVIQPKAVPFERPQPPASAAPIQPYWDHATGKWIEGAPPKGHVEVRSNGKKVFYGTVEQREQHLAAEQRKRDEADPDSALNVERRTAAAAARRPPLRRNAELSRAERQELAAVPAALTREDHDFASQTNQRGLRKAHLAASGLKPAGKRAVSAATQLEQWSARKEESRRISFKGPVERGQDRSEAYGGAAETLALKARKLRRAQLKGKPDAQHVNLLDSAELERQLAQTYRHDPGKRGQYQAYVRKDREWHADVDFLDPVENEHVIPNRFLVRPGRPWRDPDAEPDSDSDDEAERAPAAAAPEPSRGRGSSSRGRGRARGAAAPPVPRRKPSVGDDVDSDTSLAASSVPSGSFVVPSVSPAPPPSVAAAVPDARRPPFSRVPPRKVEPVTKPEVPEDLFEPFADESAYPPASSVPPAAAPPRQPQPQPVGLPPVYPPPLEYHQPPPPAYYGAAYPHPAQYAYPPPPQGYYGPPPAGPYVPAYGYPPQAYGYPPPFYGYPAPAHGYVPQYAPPPAARGRGGPARGAPPPSSSPHPRGPDAPQSGFEEEE